MNLINLLPQPSIGANGSPAAQHTYKHAKDSKRFSKLESGLFKYTRKPLGGSGGAEQYAYERLALPEFTIYGNGKVVHQQVLLTAAQAWVDQSAPMAGLGGLQHGQVIGQQLIDMGFKPQET